MATVSEALALAVDHHRAGRLADAEALYGRILDAVPDQPEALHLRGVLLAQTGRAEAGLSSVEAALAVEPGAAVFHLNRGKIRDALGRHDAAADSYRDALLRQPDLAEAWERAGQALRRLAERAFDAADFPRAEAWYRRVLALAPGDLVATFDRAMVLKHRGDPGGSAAALGHAVRLNPGLERAHRERAELLSTLGRWAEALESRRAILAIRPDDAEGWWALAVSLHRAGKVGRVAGTYRRLLALDPAHAGGWGNLGLALQEAGRGMAAVAAGRRAVRAAPMDEGAAVNLGSALHRAERFAQAEAAGRWALALDPASPDALLNLAAALEERHATEAAGRALRRLLRLRPGEAPALAQIGRLCERAGHAERAVGVLRRALAAQPAEGESWAALARIRLRRADPSGALVSARRSLRVTPGLPSGLLAEGEALEGLGADAEALAVYDRVIARTPGIGTAFTRRALHLLRPVVAAPPPRAASGRGRLAASCLGRAGRFGNQLLQYGVLRIAAERNGLELEAPDWIGRPLYGLDDPLPGSPLPILHEGEFEVGDLLGGDPLEGGRPALGAGRDVVGFFCGDTTPLAPHRDRFRSLFRLAGPAAAHADRAEAALRSRGRTLVAIHLRRGDFGSGRFWVAPESWYLDWLASVWPGLDRPVLYVATDDAAVIRRFAAYAPLHAGDLAAPLPGAEFLLDHRVLSSADLLAVSNSSFSVTAAMLNSRAVATLRPDRAAGGLRPFDPWAEPVLLD